MCFQVEELKNRNSSAPGGLGFKSQSARFDPSVATAQRRKDAKFFLLFLCVVAPLRLSDLRTRRPGADDIHIFHRTPSSQARQAIILLIGAVPIEKVPGVPGLLAFREKLALGELGTLALLAVFSTHTGPTYNFSQLLPEYPFFIRRVLGDLASLRPCELKSINRAFTV
ncbi:hypothetical protein RCIA90 [Methanocella arvoryzae MRE50]|uniref:Uncharacterized protein n=1 Tax=Methanocella arvoryzae (strain DSM 22066 / NBRC 105507 / MRE50) TaxID=351160 RepID=Q0W4Y2_METAR|nr:hypothetical protein RCIA90 [Methanocella arvoryzae MRE50]